MPFRHIEPLLVETDLVVDSARWLRTCLGRILRQRSGDSNDSVTKIVAHWSREIGREHV